MLAFCAACLVVAMRFMAAVGVSTGRISVGASYDPNDIAMVLATLFPFVAYAFVQGGLRARLFCTALMGGIMLGILSTGSRGGLLALGVAGALLAFTPGTGVKIWHKLFVVVLAAGFFMSPAADKVKKRFQEVLSGRDYNLDTSEKTGGGRLMIWSDALKAIAERPLTGVGVGNATTAMGAEYHRWMTVHNSYLQVGVELGVPGLIVFLLLLRTIWRNCREGAPRLHARAGHAIRGFAGHMHQNRSRDLRCGCVLSFPGVFGRGAYPPASIERACAFI